MKKILIITSVVFLCIFSFLTLNIQDNNESSTLELIQNQALADGEVGIGFFCAHISTDICFVESDGWFVMGEIVIIGG